MKLGRAADGIMSAGGRSDEQQLSQEGQKRWTRGSLGRFVGVAGGGAARGAEDIGGLAWPSAVDVYRTAVCVVSMRVGCAFMECRGGRVGVMTKK